MEQLDYPNAQQLLSLAENEIQQVKDKYNEASFTKLEHDMNCYGPVKQPPRPVNKHKESPPPYRDQTMWESMAWSFAQASPGPTQNQVQTMSNEGKSYFASPLRNEIQRILNSVSAHRPHRLEEARILLDRISTTFRIAQQCAATAAAIKIACYRSPHQPRYQTLSMVRGMENSVYEISSHLPNTIWRTRASFEDYLKNEKPDVRVLLLSNSNANQNIVGYHAVKRLQLHAGSRVEHVARVVGIGGYKVEVSNPNFIGPDLPDVLVADVLKHHVTSTITADMHGFSSLYSP